MYSAEEIRILCERTRLYDPTGTLYGHGSASLAQTVPAPATLGLTAFGLVKIHAYPPDMIFQSLIVNRLQ